jgi:hypothetical protein
MKNWLLQQATEVSAWAGLALMLAPLTPHWALPVVAGALLISIDDTKAAALAQKAKAKLVEWGWLS